MIPNYCSITRQTADQKHLDVLERFQNKPDRMMLGVPSITNTREVYAYDKLKWTNLQNRWRINQCLYNVHKCLNNNVPEYIRNHSTEVIVSKA